MCRKDNRRPLSVITRLLCNSYKYLPLCTKYGVHCFSLSSLICCLHLSGLPKDGTPVYELPTKDYGICVTLLIRFHTCFKIPSTQRDWYAPLFVMACFTHLYRCTTHNRHTLQINTLLNINKMHETMTYMCYLYASFN